MKVRQIIAIAGLVTTSAVWARADNTDDIKVLKEQVEQLQQRIKVLESSQEVENKDSVPAAKPAPVLIAGKDGFAFQSADTNFVIRLKGGLQTDGRFFLNDTPANDTFLLRRVRPILEGTVFEKYDFRMMTDFASGVSSSEGNNGTILDAYGNARLLPEFQIRIGKFKEPVGLERLQSWQNLLFVERGFPTQLVPNRDTGLMFHGGLFESRLNYELGVFNGTADGGSSDFDFSDDEKDVAARLFAHPFRGGGSSWLEGLGMGISGTFGDHEGRLRGYSSPGQQRFFSFHSIASSLGSTNVIANGQTWRLSPQGYYYVGPFGLLAEYVISNQRVRSEVANSSGALTSGSSSDLQQKAWQMMVSWFLTGEKNSFKPVVPRTPFSITEGGWGAWEIAARVGELDIDNDAFPVFANPGSSATKALSFGVALNWYLNQNVKANLNYEHTNFEGGDGNPALVEDEDLIVTRAQFTF